MGLISFSYVTCKGWRDRYEEGESLRDIANSIKELGYDVHFTQIGVGIESVGGQLRDRTEGQLLAHERKRQKYD